MKLPEDVLSQGARSQSGVMTLTFHTGKKSLFMSQCGISWGKGVLQLFSSASQFELSGKVGLFLIRGSAASSCPDSGAAARLLVTHRSSLNSATLQANQVMTPRWLPIQPVSRMTVCSFPAREY